MTKSHQANRDNYRLKYLDSLVVFEDINCIALAYGLDQDKQHYKLHHADMDVNGRYTLIGKCIDTISKDDYETLEAWELPDNAHIKYK